MSKLPTKLAAALEAVAGNAHVFVNPELQIDKLAPALLVEPASAQEVAACLEVCSEMNIAVVPAGRGTWLECGNPLRRADVVLSLERMSRVVDYSAPDLTITVEAGMTLRELNEIVGRDRLWLPLDPPGRRASSVGAIAACNSSGALRCGYGTPRDYVIGLKLAHADGLDSKSGGRVAKNVAGYDLNKLYVGSYGTLAVITESTFKLRPLPEQSVTVSLTAKNPALLTALAQRVRASELQPAAFVLIANLLAERVAPKSAVDTLLMRFADNQAAVTYQLQWLRQACADEYDYMEVCGDKEADLWANINDLDEQASYAIRLSVPLSAALAVYEQLLDENRCTVAASPDSGIVRAAWDGSDDAAVAFIKRWRAAAQRIGGTLFIEKAPTLVRQQADAWGEVGAAEQLMKAIKSKFDPQSILNPGRFVAGI